VGIWGRWRKGDLVRANSGRRKKVVEHETTGRKNREQTTKREGRGSSLDEEDRIRVKRRQVARAIRTEGLEGETGNKTSSKGQGTST